MIYHGKSTDEQRTMLPIITLFILMTKIY